MSLPKPLQDQYIERQEKYNDLTEELQYLSQAKIRDNLSPKDQFKLKKQIKQLEEEREKVLRQLQELDQTTKSEQLYRTMLRLGYKKQIEAFLELVKAQSVQAFLIHGSPKYGQHWLLNRLVTQYIPDSFIGPKPQIHLNRIGRQSNVDALWRELGSRLEKGGWRLSREEMIERVYQWQTTHNVLLIFHHVDWISPECLHHLISEFWEPLVNQAKQTGALQSKYKLLMFLVDYEGTVGSLDKLFTETIDPTQPDNPVKLPKINRFSEEELTDWMVKGFGELPVELTHNYEDTVQIILEESGQGIPEYVLEGIFERCGFDYHEEIKNLLTLEII